MRIFVGAFVMEFRRLLRDRHALLVLLLMPAVFVLVMSLALENSFRAHSDHPLSLLVAGPANGPGGRALFDALSQVRGVRVSRVASPQQLTKEVATGRADFGLVIEESRADHPDTPPTLMLYADPTVPSAFRRMLVDTLRSALAERAVTATAHSLGIRGLPAVPRLEIASPSPAPVPTPIQQSAPAWSLLAMFFLVIPLSTSLLRDRDVGVLERLLTLPVHPWVTLVARVLPYFALNMLQLAITLAEGVWLLPLLGGQGLSLGHSPAGLVVAAVAANLAALSYGLLVAGFMRSHEQATSFGAISVLILAALGGIMVPRFAMPPGLAQIGAMSPLGWALDAFQTIFVRDGGLADIRLPVLKLLAFAGLCLLVAVMRLRALTREG